MKLNPLQNDRAAGVLVAMAAGDALGAGYEFGAPLPDGTEVTMKGGGPFGFAPAEVDRRHVHGHPHRPGAARVFGRRSGFTGRPDHDGEGVDCLAAEARDVGARTSSVIAAARQLASQPGRAKSTPPDISRCRGLPRPHRPQRRQRIPQFIRGIKNWMFGGEGLFFAILSEETKCGYNHCPLAGWPVASFSIARNSDVGGKKEVFWEDWGIC